MRLWSLALLASLSAVLAASGCSLTDCSFEVARAQTQGGRLLADGAGAGDTLTVAFVSAGLEVLGYNDAVGEPPDRLVPIAATADGSVEIVYDARATTYSATGPLQPLVTATRDGVVYVYLEGALDEGLFQQTCSPPYVGVEIRVREVRVPDGVVAVRLTQVWADDLAPAARLRSPDAGRRAARLITA